MSGIIGLIHFPPDQLESISAQIANQLRRFDWNTWDWWTSANRNLSLGRVDIGTFNPKPQPVISPDGNVIAFFSGELYRTEKLRKELEKQGCQFTRADDPELVLNAYLAYGANFAAMLEGVFHLAILDQNTPELIIANDRFGLRPLYWAQYNDRFVFAPEVKALLVDPAFAKKLNLVSMAEYMRFQVLLGDKTFLQGINLLPGASLLRYRIEDRQLKITPYWSFANIPTLDSKITYGEIVKETAYIFQETVNRLGTDSLRVGLYLTGGLDSRLIGGCLAKQFRGFKTITYGNKNSRDVILAKHIALKLGSDHHFFEFKDGCWVLDYVDLHLDLTEGHHSWIHGHGLSTLKDVRSLLDVNLTGWALGGVLGGNWWDPLLDNAVDDWAFECYLFDFYCQKHTWPGLTEAEEASLYSDEFFKKIEGIAFDSLRSEVQKLNTFPRNRRAQYFHLNRNQRLTQNFVIFNSHYFENRFPGHDYNFFDFIYSLPSDYKANRRLQKDVIEYINPKLALIPQTKDGLLFTRKRGRRLTHHIITRVKQRTNRHIAPTFWEPVPLYADYENWLRNELRDWATNLLLDGQMASRGIFNMDFVSSLLNRHFSGHELHTIGKIAPLMTFEMMLRKYFDE